MSEGPLLEFVVAELESRKGHWPQIGIDAGVPYFTIAKIAGGKTKNPQINTVQKLADYLRANPVKTEAA